MEIELQTLVDAARAGDTAEFESLCGYVRRQARRDAEWYLGLARDDEAILRRAFLQTLSSSAGPAALEAARQLTDDPDEGVRWELVTAIRRIRNWSVDGAVTALLLDESSRVQVAAVELTRGRSEFEPAVLQRLTDSDWKVRQAAAIALSEASAAAMPALLNVIGSDSDSDVTSSAAQSLEELFLRNKGWPATVGQPSVPQLNEAQPKVQSNLHPTLHRWLGDRLAHDVDLEKLRTFGTVLTLESEAGRLPRAYGLDASLAAVRNLLLGDSPRAVVLLGESGVGKTALVNELAHRLRQEPEGPWHVVRVSPAEVLAGTVYIGEWQTKVRDLIATIRHPKKVVLYVPNLDELTTAGRSSSTTSNVASALAPHIESGDVVILGESTPDAFRDGMGGNSSLRRLFHAVEVSPTEPQDTRRIVRAVADELAAELPDSVLDRLIDLADAYMVGTAQPGCAVGLLRRVLNAAGQSRPITERDLLETLSTSTGLPLDYLDDAVPIDRGKIREFFEARVMGQPEAIDAVMERVALIKAGLTDPAKPFGVLFFVGPTGVGKTELARAMSELLFGDANRMIRLDMSEFATYDAHERLLGWGTKPGLLTGPVRDQPFSLLLLDEIEKAHPNVFDLCLQLFDAGRLTDTSGRTTDFRRTLIVLTSNVGAAVPDGRSVGFDARPSRAGYDPAGTAREMSRWFRPEFLNRLDRIVTFRPLDAETVEQIARREVQRVLERSGITRRRLSVDVDPAVLSLLLKEGYSPTYGARPLKRTVERLVLLPVAWWVAGP